MSGPWQKVVYAFECEPCDACGDPICPNCDGEHYADCTCPGPHQDDEFEYDNTGEYARRKINGHHIPG